MFKIFKELYEDAKNIAKKDPAARNILYVVFLYQGFHALIFYRFSHFLNKYKLFFLARLFSQMRKIFYGNRNSSRCKNRKKIVY